MRYRFCQVISKLLVRRDRMDGHLLRFHIWSKVKCKGFDSFNSPSQKMQVLLSKSRIGHNTAFITAICMLWPSCQHLPVLPIWIHVACLLDAILLSLDLRKYTPTNDPRYCHCRHHSVSIYFWLGNDLLAKSSRFCPFMPSQSLSHYISTKLMADAFFCADRNTTTAWYPFQS